MIFLMRQSNIFAAYKLVIPAPTAHISPSEPDVTSSETSTHVKRQPSAVSPPAHGSEASQARAEPRVSVREAVAHQAGEGSATAQRGETAAVAGGDGGAGPKVKSLQGTKEPQNICEKRWEDVRRDGGEDDDCVLVEDEDEGGEDGRDEEEIDDGGEGVDGGEQSHPSSTISIGDPDAGVDEDDELAMWLCDNKTPCSKLGDHFTKDAMVGQGGFGKVFSGTHIATGRRVAIKEINTLKTNVVGRATSSFVLARPPRPRSQHCPAFVGWRLHLGCLLPPSQRRCDPCESVFPFLPF